MSLFAALAAAMLTTGPAIRSEPVGRSAVPAPPGDQPRISNTVRPQGRCEVAPASPDLKLFVLGHYEAATLSSVWIGDPEETSVADVEIGPGDPLHLVINGFERTVYRLSGEVDRVRRLTLISHFGAGATGIPADRIEHARRCFNSDFFRESASAREAVGNLFGRAPDAFEGISGLGRARIGNEIRIAQLPRMRARFDPETDQLYRFHPGGLSWVDASSVASDVTVGRYRVLPQEAGVRQLVMSGALVKASRADAEQWERQARKHGAANPRGVHGLHYGVYRVTRPIEMPPGLCGSHRIHLYAPSPDFIRGDPCHSTLYYSSDGVEAGPLVN